MSFVSMAALGATAGAYMVFETWTSGGVLHAQQT